MKIALIGPGAMGLLFGGYLSKHHDVTLIGRNPEIMSAINQNGLTILETCGTETRYYLKAGTAGEAEPAELVILFTKAGSSRQALEENRSLIGEGTYLMTLQNGAGHEALLQEFAKPEQIIIGTTQQGSYKLGATSICHSGGGETYFGAVSGDSSRFEHIAEAFRECGFPAHTADQVKGMIWNKLMINASSSVLSGILQTAQGFVAEDPSAWNIAQKLIKELCAVATADGYPFDEEGQIIRLQNHLRKAPSGYTSIYADLKAGRKTEVDVISGFVVETGHRLGIPVPTHELMVELVHAMENRP